MIAAELRGGSKPSLNEALGWIGSRVDDIYGANVGRLDDVWIDPGTGVPRWLLVKEGRFGGRTTLIPFEDATAGAGHVWVPYERDVVRDAPEIESGAPLTQYVEAALRSHYAANAPSGVAHSQQTQPSQQAYQSQEAHPEQQAGRQAGSAMGTATVRFHTPPEAGPPEFFAQQRAEARRSDHHVPPQRPVLRAQPAPAPAAQPPQQPTFPQPQQAPRLPDRPAPPIAAPEPQREEAPREWAPQQQPPQAQQVYAPPQAYVPPRQSYIPPQAPVQPAPYTSPRGYTPVQQPYVPQQPPYTSPRQEPPRRPRPQAQPVREQPAPVDAAQGPIDQLRALAEDEGTHYVEIELSGELTIRGELRSVKVTPRAGGDTTPS